MASGVKPPIWFWVVALLLVAWQGIGVFFCIDQLRHGAQSMMWEQSAHDRAAYAALPVWFNYVYIAATFGGLFGGLALLLRERRSIVFFWISLIAIIIQFGYVFAATDTIAYKGFAKAVPFPVLIALIGAFSIWFAGLAAKRGWIGR